MERRPPVIQREPLRASRWNWVNPGAGPPPASLPSPSPPRNAAEAEMLRPLFALTKSLPLPPFAYFIPEHLERGGREGLGERWGEGLPPRPPPSLSWGWWAGLLTSVPLGAHRGLSVARRPGPWWRGPPPRSPARVPWPHRRADCLGVTGLPLSPVWSPSRGAPLLCTLTPHPESHGPVTQPVSASCGHRL